MKESEIKKKPIFKKIWFWILIFLIIIIGGVGYQMTNAELVDKRDEKYKNTWNINDTIEDNGFELTVLGMNDKNITMDFASPSNGKQFILVNVRLKNVSNSNKTIDISDFKIQNSNGEIIEYYHTTGLLGDFYFKGGKNNLLENVELIPGGFKEGNILFEVEKDPTSLILIFNNNILKGNNDIKIKLK